MTCIRRVEDGAGRAVVLLEPHHAARREVLLEVEDVADVRAAPAVDRLVVVADHHQVAVRRRQQLQEPVLRAVRVLVLVDEQEAGTARRYARAPVLVLANSSTGLTSRSSKSNAFCSRSASGRRGTPAPRRGVNGSPASCVLRRRHELVLRGRDRAVHRLRVPPLRREVQPLEIALVSRSDWSAS
jgi:hypothetical protein